MKYSILLLAGFLGYQLVFAQANNAGTRVLDFRSGLEQRLADERKTCAVDTLRETLIQKHGSYIERLGAEDKEACIQSLQTTEVLRCDKLFSMLEKQIAILNPEAMKAETLKPEFSETVYSQALTSRLIQEVQVVRGETLDRIDSIFSSTQCSLLRGFSGYFAKRNLKNGLNQKLDEQVNALSSTQLRFDGL